jgi:hypothetical protein
MTTITKKGGMSRNGGNPGTAVKGFFCFSKKSYRRLSRISAVMGIPAVFLLSPAQAATRYASATGTGSTCAQATPCLLAIALSGAASGDTIVVNPGSYAGIAISVPNLTITAPDAVKTALGQETCPRAAWFSNVVAAHGLPTGCGQWSGTDNRPLFTSNVSINASGVTFEYMRVRMAATRSDSDGEALGIDAENVTVRDCEIFNGGQGIYVWVKRNVTIAHNYIHALGILGTTTDTHNIGICGSGTESTGFGTQILIQSNTLQDGGGDGIQENTNAYCSGTFSYMTVEANYLADYDEQCGDFKGTRNLRWHLNECTRPGEGGLSSTNDPAVVARTDWDIWDNFFHDITDYIINPSNGSTACSRWRIWNNVIARTDTAPAYNGASINLCGDAGSYVVFNTLVDNTDAGANHSWGVSNLGSGNNIRNNIFYRNGTGGDDHGHMSALSGEDGGTPNTNYVNSPSPPNCGATSAQCGTNPISTCFAANNCPGFTNLAADDYTLQSGSPAKAAGLALGSHVSLTDNGAFTPSHDMLGTARPAAPALGALEPGAPPSTVSTTGGVTWLDPLAYQKPAFVPITIPNEAAVTNKYYVDMNAGSGSTCSQASPCANIDNVIGKPGTTGGPAYIYVRGAGGLSLFNDTFYGSPGNEIVIKPWPGSTAIFTGNSNTNSANVHDLIFDGGPGLGIAFQSDQAGDFYSFHIMSNNTTLYRTRHYSTAASGSLLLSVGDGPAVSGVRIINSEFYGCNTASGYQCSAVYAGPGATGGYTNLLIQNNIIRDMGGDGIEINPRVASSGLTITGNAIHNVGKQTCSGAWLCRPAITLGSQNGQANPNTVVSNNLMWDIGSGCIWARSPGSSQVIYNNTCYDYGKINPETNSSPNPEGISGGNVSSVKNNIIFAPNGTLPIEGTVSGSNNICNGTGCAAAYTASVLASVDPNNAAFLTIGANSPARDAGANTGVTPDYRGIARPQGTAYDIGAYELTGAAPPTSACDLNGDSATNVSDVQLCVNQAIGTATCSTGDINQDSACNVVDVQRTVNAALGGPCVTQ